MEYLGQTEHSRVYRYDTYQNGCQFAEHMLNTFPFAGYLLDSETRTVTLDYEDFDEDRPLYGGLPSSEALPLVFKLNLN